MGYRYCPECDEWLETAEIALDESGETVCPDHKAVYGFIGSPWITEGEFRRDHDWMPDCTVELQAAKRQQLVR